MSGDSDDMRHLGMCVVGVVWVDYSDDYFMPVEDVISKFTSMLSVSMIEWNNSPLQNTLQG